MRLIATLVFIGFSCVSNAQFIYVGKLDKSLVSKVRIKTSERTRVKDMKASIKDSLGNVIQSVHIRWNAQFTIEVPYDQVWDLWVTCDGYQTKVLRYNTMNVPDCEGRNGFWFGDLTVHLEKDEGYSHVNRVASIFYEPSIARFDFEKY
ncbi:MAG: hypothetical protein R2813_06510 [Flavobacteriales bacterium]